MRVIVCENSGHSVMDDLEYKDVSDRRKLDELMPWSEKYRAWQHEKLMNNKAFSLNSEEKPYYRPGKGKQPSEENQAAG